MMADVRGSISGSRDAGEHGDRYLFHRELETGTSPRVRQN